MAEGTGSARRGPGPLDRKAARAAALDLLSRRALSRRELQQRLTRRGAPPAVAAEIVTELCGRGYLDDEALAHAWAESRARLRGIGPVRLRQELGRRGIPRDLAHRAVAQAFQETGELERALEAGRRRLPAALRAGPARATARLGAYLLRRGYPSAMVARVVRRLLPDGPGPPGGSEADPEGGV